MSSFSTIDEIEVLEVTSKDQNLIQLLILVLFSLLIISIFNKLKVPAALLSGTLIASGFLQILGIASYRLPPNIIDFSLLILGSSVGCRFADKTFNDIVKCFTFNILVFRFIML